jgi:ribosomal protein S18 acetylase RimI-like enzyme
MDLKQLTIKDTNWAGQVLGQAFLNDPMLNYVVGDKKNKEQLITWFVTCSFRYGALFGQCFATSDNDGILIMLPPDQTKMTMGKMYKAGMLSAPFKLGLTGFSNFMTMADFTDKEHKLAAPSDHFYLFGMGVLPDKQGKGIGKQLMTKALQIADDNKMPCYLETQNKKNVSFYESFGFTVVSDKQLPKGGLQNWGMLRQK